MSLFYKISLFLLILILGVAGIAIYYTFYNQLPDHTGTIETPGIEESVGIHWDPYGVPYIIAQSNDDLFFATGYLHAQDRLWQLTLSQLMAEGRFAEYLGSNFIELDKHQRTLGFWRTAQKIEEASPDSLLHALQQYADGINAFVEQNTDKLPVELTLLGFEPPHWTPTHSIAISRLMAWDQNIHWKSEITIARIAEEIGAGRLNQLYPSRINSFQSFKILHDSTLKHIEKTFIEPGLQAQKLLGTEGSAVGSNAWAVSGRRTNSGQPILAGDPHMGLSMPGFWYELSAITPDRSIAGATIPGSPFIVLGQSSRLAWSITNMMADDTDFFLIQEDPQNSDRYVADSLNGEASFTNYQWQEEIIKVHDGDDYFHRIPHTEHGPVINTTHPDSSRLSPAMPVAMQWAGHEVSHELWALYKMNHASSLPQFTDALKHFGTPAMNFIYADADDNIALIGAGNLPVRSSTPTLFLEGWNPDHQWQDWIPFNELPRLENPETGYVAHANNYINQQEPAPYIGRFWAPNSRITRIRNLLEGESKTDDQMMKQIQNDVYSVHAADLLEILLPMIRSAQVDDEFETALTYLQNWDLEYSKNSTAATIFDLFFINLSEIVLTRVIPEDLYEGLVRLEYIPVAMVSHILTDGGSFFNVVEDENIRLRQKNIRDAMNVTLNQLREQLGPEPFEWRWESLHTLSLRPPLLGEISEHPQSPESLRIIVKNLLSSGPHPVPGHGMTVNKSEYSWNNPFEVRLGPSIRRIVNFGSPSRSLSVLPTGQSGQSLSTNYGDQTELWLNGGYRYIYNDSTFFKASNYKTMKLEPLSIQ